ncbi:MAG: hypothetical protein EZS28_003987, partial [Streblomastix strix]
MQIDEDQDLKKLRDTPRLIVGLKALLDTTEDVDEDEMIEIQSTEKEGNQKEIDMAQNNKKQRYPEQLESRILRFEGINEQKEIKGNNGLIIQSGFNQPVLLLSRRDYIGTQSWANKQIINEMPFGLGRFGMAVIPPLIVFPRIKPHIWLPHSYFLLSQLGTNTGHLYHGVLCDTAQTFPQSLFFQLRTHILYTSEIRDHARRYSLAYSQRAYQMTGQNAGATYAQNLMILGQGSKQLDKRRIQLAEARFGHSLASIDQGTLLVPTKILFQFMKAVVAQKAVTNNITNSSTNTSQTVSANASAVPSATATPRITPVPQVTKLQSQQVTASQQSSSTAQTQLQSQQIQIQQIIPSPFNHPDDDWQLSHKRSQEIQMVLRSNHTELYRILDRLARAIYDIRLHPSHIIINSIDILLHSWEALLDSCDGIRSADGKYLEILPQHLVRSQNQQQSSTIKVACLAVLHSQSLALATHIFCNRKELSPQFIVFASGLISLFPLSQSDEKDKRSQNKQLAPTASLLSALRYLLTWRDILADLTPSTLSLSSSAPRLTRLSPQLHSAMISIPGLCSQLNPSSAPPRGRLISFLQEDEIRGEMASEFEKREIISSIHQAVSVRRRSSPFGFYVSLDTMIAHEENTAIKPLQIPTNKESQQISTHQIIPIQRTYIPLTVPLYTPLISFISVTNTLHTFAVYTSWFCPFTSPVYATQTQKHALHWLKQSRDVMKMPLLLPEYIKGPTSTPTKSHQTQILDQSQSLQKLPQITSILEATQILMQSETPDYSAQLYSPNLHQLISLIPSTNAIFLPSLSTHIAQPLSSSIAVSPQATQAGLHKSLNTASGTSRQRLQRRKYGIQQNYSHLYLDYGDNFGDKSTWATTARASFDKDFYKKDLFPITSEADFSVIEGDQNQNSTNILLNQEFRLGSPFSEIDQLETSRLSNSQDDMMRATGIAYATIPVSIPLAQDLILVRDLEEGITLFEVQQRWGDKIRVRSRIPLPNLLGMVQHLKYWKNYNFFHSYNVLNL